MVQVVYRGIHLGRGSQLAAAQHHHAGIGGFGRQQVGRLGRKLLLLLGIHNSNHVAHTVPLIQRFVVQDVKKFIYIKNTARLNNDPVKALHGQRDQFGAHPALVGIAVAPAADAFHIAMVAQNILQQHNIHIDRAKVIFQNADIPALLNHIAGIVPHKSRFARAKKAGDQIDLYHSCSPPVGGKLLVPVIISHFYSVCFIKPKFKKKNRHTGPCSCAAVFP